jgi:hypothetical protein
LVGDLGTQFQFGSECVISQVQGRGTGSCFKPGHLVRNRVRSGIQALCSGPSVMLCLVENRLVDKTPVPDSGAGSGSEPGRLVRNQAWSGCEAIELRLGSDIGFRQLVWEPRSTLVKRRLWCGIQISSLVLDGIRSWSGIKIGVGRRLGSEKFRSGLSLSEEHFVVSFHRDINFNLRQF